MIYFVLMVIYTLYLLSFRQPSLFCSICYRLISGNSVGYVDLVLCFYIMYLTVYIYV